MQFMAVFIVFPWAALAIAALLAILHTRRGGSMLALAAVAWLLYGVYEVLMYHRILCTGECNIRVDLLLIYPVLLVLSAGALIAALRRR